MKMQQRVASRKHKERTRILRLRILYYTSKSLAHFSQISFHFHFWYSWAGDAPGGGREYCGGEVGYDRKPSVRHVGEDSLEANLYKARVGVMTDAVVGLGWVLRRGRRVTLMGKIAATALVSGALGIDHVDPHYTPPAIVAEGAEYEK